MIDSRLLPASILFTTLALAHTPHANATGELEVVVSYSAAALQTPESVGTDLWGNRYVSLALTGEISRISPDGEVETLANLPVTPFEPCYDFIAVMNALTVTPWGLYVNVNSCDLESRGVWWVSRITGESARIAALPPESRGNGIAYRAGHLYIADSTQGKIWRTSVFGGNIEVWVEDPLLDVAPNEFLAPGANGIQFFDNELYVSNSSTGDIIAFPMEPGHQPGEPRIHANVVCDDFAFDVEGTLYCTTNPFNTVVAVYPDGESEVLLTIEDGLDGPTSTTFGRKGDKHTLYITNAAFPLFPNQGTPSLMSLELNVPGYPFR